MKDTLFLLLGTNLGDRNKNLALARKAIEVSVGPIVKASSLYQTAAWGKTDQPEFLNQVLRVETTLKAQHVLEEILRIEKTLGRERIEKWGERIIDIDILLFGNEIVNTPTLTIPHPQMAIRRFVLAPLAEIAADVKHPVLKIKISDMLNQCSDPLTVSRLSSASA